MEFSLRETAVLIAALRCLARQSGEWLLLPPDLQAILDDSPGEIATLADECHDLADRINNED
jgi:hypothetical protein